MVTVDQLPNFGKNELVSVILSHEAMDASLAATQIAQLQGKQGKVVSLNTTNSLLVTDTGSNLRFIHRLLEGGAFSRPKTVSTGTAVKSFTLQHVRADEAERLIRTLFGLPPTESSASNVASAAGLSIATDVRTNRLFISTTSDKLATIEQIVAAYDVADASTSLSPQRQTTTTRIVPLPHADVIIIGQALKSLSPRIRVSTTRSARGANSAGSDATNKAGTTGKPGDDPAAGARPRVETPKHLDGRNR
jgi:type II secretory pathway component GspD/PulD (secretin)